MEQCVLARQVIAFNLPVQFVTRGRPKISMGNFSRMFEARFGTLLAEALTQPHPYGRVSVLEYGGHA